MVKNLPAFRDPAVPEQGWPGLHHGRPDLLCGLQPAGPASDSPGPGPQLPGLLPLAFSLHGPPQLPAQAQGLPGLPGACEPAHQWQRETERACSTVCTRQGAACFPFPRTNKTSKRGKKKKKESACQCRRHKRCRFDPRVEKTLWRRAWQPIPVFLPGKFYGQKRLVNSSPWGVWHD